jgi:hypothetical protein
MKHVWSILCEKSSIDMESNLLSLFSCLEEISVVLDKDKVQNSNKKMIIPANFQLVSFWSIEDEQKDNILKTKVELVSPDGEVLNQFSNSFQVKAGTRRFRNRANIQGVPVIGEGRHFLKVWQEKDGENYSLVAELPLDIKISYKLMDKKA